MSKPYSSAAVSATIRNQPVCNGDHCRLPNEVPCKCSKTPCYANPDDSCVVCALPQNGKLSGTGNPLSWIY